jgi:hypothetical protein
MLQVVQVVLGHLAGEAVAEDLALQQLAQILLAEPVAQVVKEIGIRHLGIILVLIGVQQHRIVQVRPLIRAWLQYNILIRMRQHRIQQVLLL